jgi:iron complex transport system substrate-binding protein
VKTDAPGRDIDRQVKGLVQEALSIYHIDIDRLKQLRPDILLTQDQCEVCAVSLAEVEQAVGRWVSPRGVAVSGRAR